MKTLVLFCTLCASSLAQFNIRAPPVYRMETHNPSGEYSITYETVDGTVISEQGILKATPDGSDNVLVKEGSYKFTSPEGVPVHLRYSADEYGFHPHGNVLPVSLPVLPSFSSQ